ncbi:adenine-specific DNA-methyltransferase [Peptoniphilus ivorii]|uniref:DNA adenine methylase n=1 Tax=Aedoeadaptatus ivorii TaxID=54006 RepID=UPI0027881E18|nr:DNA adenine methylase [Peptoniphilus ivorii]MDQ0508259.1 adenine-specific DNA-methyltransferase [Peptoniphilus ivorii]
MRFIGGKTLIIPYILELIEKKTKNIKSISDVFAGSGVVSREFKNMGYDVISNDLMYFSYVLLRGTVGINSKLEFQNLNISNPIEYLNNINLESIDNNLKNCFVYQNYSPKGGRMYFTEENALKVDLVRTQIENWYKNSLINEDEYFYLLTCLIEAVPFVSNITGVYGAYLKHWDKRALNNLKLKNVGLSINNSVGQSYNEDSNKLIENIKTDLAYFDPPYNQRQYLPNYHVLETIAKYDNPRIKGVTGLRDYSEQKSDYCRKDSVFNTFEDLIKKTNSRYIILSYNTEGLLSHDEIIGILEKYGKKSTVDYKFIDYKRYKNAQTNKNKNLKEILYFVEKE